MAAPLAALGRPLFALAALLAVGAAAAPLPAYNLDPAQTSVSGISSGAYMAVQYGVAHSGSVMGVGAFAGGPYRCAAGLDDALQRCTQGQPDLERALRATERAAAAGQIDPLANLARQRVWLFSGYNDGVVKREVVDSLHAYYLRFLPRHQLYYQDALGAGHAMVTETYGSRCAATGGEFINDCDYDGAGLLLQHIYGRLAARRSGPLNGRFLSVDQGAGVPWDPSTVSMAGEGYVYVPADCLAGGTCRLHVAFHGCRQYAATLGDSFYRNAGYNEWADTNRIVVLYPQTIARTLTPFNPKGCWDWWGYTGAGFAARDGAQIATVQAMVERLTAGYQGEPAPAAGEVPRLLAVDAADDSVALAWNAGGEADGYHLYRADNADGPFQRLTVEALTATSFADHEVVPERRYHYQLATLRGTVEIARSQPVEVATRAPAPACDPYFSDNPTHVAQGRARVWFGLTFARGSWDYMGLWNPFTERALYRDGDGYSVGVCP